MATGECDRDGRSRLAGTAIRGEPHPPEVGGLQDARIAQRGRGRPPGGLAPPKPLREEQRREPEGWLTTVAARVCLDMLRSRSEEGSRAGVRPWSSRGLLEAAKRLFRAVGMSHAPPHGD